MRNVYTTVSLILLVTSTCFYSSYGQVYPAGFAQVLVTNKLLAPTAMAFAPDGRIFVTEQDGKVVVIKNNTLLPTPFATVTVESVGERGLLGIALDPNFSTNNYVYVYYTVSGSPSHNRIIRFTANGDVAQAGSETIILELDPLGSALIHNGGAMHFGKDGKLYIGVGDNSNSANPQNLDTYHGKLLRINKDGSVPSGNPFTTGSEQRKRIWAYGFRNPYTFAIHPQTGKIFVNDVGGSLWEEINDATTGGKNFGWPETEGNFDQNTHPDLTNPVYAYMHDPAAVDVKGCAITGGVFFNPTTTNYPAIYVGKYFFRDFCNDWINILDVSGSSAVRASFATNIGGNGVIITLGNDGNLYYFSRETLSLFKIIYNNTQAPYITSQPANLSLIVGQQATFTVAVLGSAPLSYQWQKNGVNIPGAANATFTISSTVLADNGNYRVRVSNAFGNATSTAATLSVIVNTPPVAEIISPVLGSTYAADTYINFSGSGTDAEDGPLAASSLSWNIDFHHNTHKHDEPAIDGVSSGSFLVPDEGETSDNVWYRIILTVTDSRGFKGKDSVDVIPRKSTLNFTTNPPGLQLTLDGQPLTTPASVVSVEGTLRSIGIITPQVKDNVTYTFESWSQGGPPTQTITTPPDDITLTAKYSAASTFFYRGINLNGAGVLIDGHNWEASATAPNFTYTTNRGVFAEQSATLIPATDANRATMIRSSIWGENLTLTVGGVPAGTYKVWVYVWEDNTAQTFSVSLEGTIVQANYNSGGPGIWNKLGPFQATINDGAINISAIGPGYAQPSGIEIWRVGQNQPPVVANPIANQTATVDTPFSFIFPANTFSDPDAGTVLAYSASLSNGSALPGWLTFNGGTRGFNGTPASGNIGLLNVRVTASDGAGGSVNDEFAIAVNAGGSAVFYRALNLNGPALSIDGHNWEASASAPNFTYTTNRGLFANQAITLIPATDANRASMIRSSIWGENLTLTVGAVPAGNYRVWLYVWEDNIAQTFSMSLEGTVVQANYNSGGPGIWNKLGPFQATINDGAINISATGPGYAQPSGLEIWRVGQNQPPVVANPIANQTATVGTPFNFTFPANTFSDPDAGTVLAYSASLSNGSALPGWLTFNAGTRSFSGTPGSGNVGTLNVRVTASDGAGGSVNDEFALAVNAGGSAVFYRALNLNGPALSIDGHNWEASTTAPNFTYSTNRGLFANQAVTLIPATDANRASMIRSSIWGENLTLTVSAVPAGTYRVWVYVWEDNVAQTFSMSLEGTVVQANYNSGGPGIWNKLGPFQASINDGTINISATGPGYAQPSGIEIWSVNQQVGARQAFVTGTETVGEEQGSEGLQLSAYPNPFSGKVTIAFTAKESAATQLAVYDTRGVRVRVLFEGNLLAGNSEQLEVEAENMPDGVYVFQLVNGQHVKHFRLALAR